MKLILVLFLSLPVFAQYPQTQSRPDAYFLGGWSNVVTDSVVWHITDTLNIGDPDCQHDWIEGEFTTARPGVGCLVFHNGSHCDWDDGVKSRICRKCERKERLREFWYQHFQEPPKTEYDILNEKLNPPEVPDTSIMLWNGRAVSWADTSAWVGYAVLDSAVSSASWALSYNMDDIEYHALLTRLLKDWQEYKDTCWADSSETLQYGSGKYTGPDGTVYDDLLYRPPYKVWTHRKPDGPGFMYFLERRLRK